MITSADELPRLHSAVSRLLIALDFIASHRFGVTVTELAAHLHHEFGICQRTARRDAARLAACRFINSEERQGLPSRLTINRYRVVSRMFERKNNEQ